MSKVSPACRTHFRMQVNHVPLHATLPHRRRRRGRCRRRARRRSTRRRLRRRRRRRSRARPHHILGELAEHVPRGRIFTEEQPAPGAAILDAAAGARGALPDQLREVAGGLAEARVPVIVLLPLVPPAVDGGGDVRIPFRQVFPVGAARVCELARLDVGLGEFGQRVVPCQGGRVVLLSVGVGGVEDGGFEDAAAGVLGGGWG